MKPEDVERIWDTCAGPRATVTERRRAFASAIDGLLRHVGQGLHGEVLMSDDLYTLAPPGTIYVCGACGKTSRNRAGFLDDGGRGIDSDEQGRIAQPGWDESCMLHAVLCHAEKAAGRWAAVEQ